MSPNEVGHAVAQLVRPLRYKPEVSRVRFPMESLVFSFTNSFQPHYGPGVDSTSDINEYQGCLLGVKAAGS
jgi:hypothetical protein